MTTLLYGVDGDEVRRAGILRAEAMAYRDARGSEIGEADWAAIEQQLRAAYELLKRAVAPAAR